ncbi:MAG: rubrerythrin family protein, partial [Actinobacteria bacterium]|nr:rubrerythrin family protein [Actinomycetota bacterium]
GELEEWGTLYPDFARVADEEGFPAIAASYREIAEVEQHHESRYRKLANNVELGLVFKRDDVVYWKCRNCGYVHKGAFAPELCPACKHPQAYYELHVEAF